jgi:hypothetical protein
MLALTSSSRNCTNALCDAADEDGIRPLVWDGCSLLVRAVGAAVEALATTALVIRGIEAKLLEAECGGVTDVWGARAARL